MYAQVTIHKAKGDTVFTVEDEGADILYRVNLTVEMHNGQEQEKATADPTYMPDPWTIETDETP